MSEKYILGTKIEFDIDIDNAVSRVMNFIESNDKGIVCTTNPEFLVEAKKDSEFMDIINNSLLSVPDGIGVLLAEEYLLRVSQLDKGIFFWIRALFTLISVYFDILKNPGKYVPVHGADLMRALLKSCEKMGYSVYLFGGWPKDSLGRMKEVDYDLSKRVANKIKEDYPNLHIVGATSQYNYSSSDDVRAQSNIKEDMRKGEYGHIDILFASFRHCQQEKWLVRNIDKLNVKVGIGVGGTFDFIVGNTRRAPESFRKMHLEWLYRLVTQPYRIKRIFTAFLIFPVLIYVESIKNP